MKHVTLARLSPKLLTTAKPKKMKKLPIDASAVGAQPDASNSNHNQCFGPQHKHNLYHI